MTSVRLCVALGKISAVWACKKMIFSPMWSLCGNREEVMRRWGHTETEGWMQFLGIFEINSDNCKCCLALSSGCASQSAPSFLLGGDAGAPRKSSEMSCGGILWHTGSFIQVYPLRSQDCRMGWSGDAHPFLLLSPFWGKQTYPSIHFHSRHLAE